MLFAGSIAYYSLIIYAGIIAHNINKGDVFVRLMQVMNAGSIQIIT